MIIIVEPCRNLFLWIAIKYYLVIKNEFFFLLANPNEAKWSQMKPLFKTYYFYAFICGGFQENEL